MAIQNFQKQSIRAFLNEKHYIPDYQREYSWEDTELEDMWCDLLHLCNNENDTSHFFGQVVIHWDEKEQKKYIIDGQQRTTTSVILFCVLKRIFDNISEKYSIKKAHTVSNKIEMNIIGFYDEDDNELYLTLGECDRKYFINSIQVNEPDYQEKLSIKSHRNLRNAYKFFYEKLSDMMEQQITAQAKFDVLNKLCTTFSENFIVMCIETNEENEAYIIFETLNARGRELETADLLKNHIFRNSNKDLEEVKTLWYKMIENLDKIDPTKYIRHFWNSQNTFVREKELYRSISKKIRSPRECKKLVESLEQLSQVYCSLECGGGDNYFSNEELKDSLSDLKTLKASSYTPIVLAMAYDSKYTETDMAAVVKTIESLVFRNFSICGKVANRYETKFAEIAYDIFGCKYTTTNEIIMAIDQLIVDDETFRSNFEIYSTKNKNLIRLFFRHINTLYDNEMEIIENNKKIHIEHIMPQEKGKWNLTDDDHIRLLWRLGNLALLGEEYNKNNSNKLFFYKKEYYDKSKIVTTKQLCKYEFWTEREIVQRQQRLCEDAMKIWTKLPQNNSAE